MTRFEHRVPLPGGGEIRFREMTNAEYLVLLKLMDGERAAEAYALVDDHIGRTVEGFGSMPLTLRLYTYMAFVRLCLRPSVTVRDKMEREVSVASAMEALEAALCGVPDEVVLPLADGIEGVFGPPRRFTATEDPDAYSVDFLSGLVGVRRDGAAVAASPAELESLAAALPPARAMALEARLRREYRQGADLFGTGRIGFFDGSALAATYRMMSEPLELFYQYGYVFGRYLRVPWSDYLAMTPVESLVLFRHFEEDARRQREDREREASAASAGTPGDPPGMRRLDFGGGAR